MNVGAIVEMIKEDPTILDDIPGFLARMNDENIRQVQKKHTVVEDVVKYVSIAQLNGGKATNRDVKEAKAYFEGINPRQEAKERFEKLMIAIDTGEVKTSQEIISKFSEPL